MLAAIVPLVNYCINDDFYGKLLVLFSGALGTLIYCKNTMESHLELWLQYRTASEQLKREKQLYLTKAGIYSNKSDSTAFNMLVCRTESVIAYDNIQWQETVKSCDSAPSHSTNS